MLASSRRSLQLAALGLLAVFLLGDTCTARLSRLLVAPAPDADGDLVADYCDNCRLVANRSQADTDAADPGNACDCDFDGDGVCNIDDANIFLVDHGAGADLGMPLPHGTDLDGDEDVDAGDFDAFLPLFAAGRSGDGPSEASVLDGSCDPADPDCEDPVRPGACFDHRWPRQPWAAEIPNSFLGCSSVAGLAQLAGLTQEQAAAITGDPNNPTDFFVRARTFGLVGCPNARFSSGTATVTGDSTNPLACDRHDICLSKCGYKDDDCNRQFWRDLVATCHLLTGDEREVCIDDCLLFAEAFAVGTGKPPILAIPDESPFPFQGGDLVGPDSEDAHCQCCPPVCETDADCEDVGDTTYVCEGGWCVAKRGSVGFCETDADCTDEWGPGFRCRTDLPEGAQSPNTCVPDPARLPPPRLPGDPPPVCGDGVCEAGETCHFYTGCSEDCGGCRLGDACGIDLDCAEGACGPDGRCQGLPPGAWCQRSDQCAADLFCLQNACQTQCGDGICGFRERCGDGDRPLPLECPSDCGLCPAAVGCNGDGDCESGACVFGTCSPFPLPDGSPCDSAADCETDRCDFFTCGGRACLTNADCAGLGIEVCNVFFCVPIALPNGVPCNNDAACASGLCQGICIDPLANGLPCIRNDACQSGVCNAGFCAAEGSVGLGGLCTTDAACASGRCLGVCVPQVFCGDLVCSAGETCSSCAFDCGDCCAPNNNVCLFNEDCCSGRCEGVLPPRCNACLGHNQGCDEHSDCCSGNCMGRGFLQPSTCEGN